MPAQSSSRRQDLRRVLKPTTFIDPFAYKKDLGVNLIIASETFQITGSFKFRAAYNVAANVENKTLIAASSGNFGQALACACRILKKRCIVVMPESSARIKIEACKAWGATVDLVDTTRISRAARVAELARANPGAYMTSAYDDPLVIEGNSTLGEEIVEAHPDTELIIAPIGGGGLAAGLIEGVRRSMHPHIKIFAAEPAIANDAAQSLARGEIVSLPQEAPTIADGARTLSVGKSNFEILTSGLSGVIEVPESSIKETLRDCFFKANLKVEPTGALAIAALHLSQDRFAGKKVVCVASGGNVDAAVYTELLS